MSLSRAKNAGQPCATPEVWAETTSCRQLFIMHPGRDGSAPGLPVEAHAAGIVTP
jgi:hypothetical protein